MLPYLVALMSRFTARSAEQNQFEEFRTDSPIYGGFLCWFPNYVLTYFLFFFLIPNHQMDPDGGFQPLVSCLSYLG